MNIEGYANKQPINVLKDISSDFQGEKGVFLLKLRALFKKIEESFAYPLDMNLQIPSSTIGSITVLEATVINSLLALIKPNKIFEFGTFFGYSTALFAKNTRENCKIYSIDLDTSLENLSYASTFSNEDIMAIDSKNDQYLSFLQAQKGTFYLSGLPSKQGDKVTLLKGNSMTFDYANHELHKGDFDLVFIDGGHDYATIESDTENAIKMIGNDGLIIWHDYNSRIHSDVTTFLDKRCFDEQIFHVEHTMLAFLAKGNAYDVLFS